LIAIVGNPNVGKTALFNRLTGQNARVGNYPGVTVERRTGTVKLPIAGADPLTVEIVDVPGTYSLSARGGEEQIAIDALLGRNGNPAPTLALVILDATQLVRNLYLAIQIIELGIPTVLALNLIDEVADSPPDHRSLTTILGVPCLPTSAKSGFGLPALRAALADAVRRPPHGAVEVPYGEALRADVTALLPSLPSGLPPETRAAYALWLLTSVAPGDELTGVEPSLRAAVLQAQAAALAAGRDIDAEVIVPRYAFLDREQPAFYRPPPPRNHTERVDRILLHPVFGFAAFLLIMLIMFQALFSGSDPAISAIEAAVGWLGEQASARLPASLLTDLLVEGVIGGVGNVIVFLPQILLLFFFIGLLEDSGYMARAAYLMDRIMRSLGLHGRAFVPMLSGFACAVPAIMATRTMEHKRDRLLTMMVVPLMTCSARLPVYTLIIGALFPPDHLFGLLPVQGLLMVAMYLFSVVVALVAAGVLGRTLIKGQRVPLLLELPPYRLPTLRSIFRLMVERSRSFLTEAGTVILACTVLMWALLEFPKRDLPADWDARPAAEQAAFEAASLQGSYAGQVGIALEPAIRPLGFDWKIGVGIVGAFAAREVFVSTMGIVYGVGEEVDEESAPLRDRIRAERREDGSATYTPLVGLSLMVFFALACQCMSTLAIVKRETRGWAWPSFLFVYMTGLAWVASFVVYQGGRWLGFEG
jgi:ferrous iron transport protein B